MTGVIVGVLVAFLVALIVVLIVYVRRERPQWAVDAGLVQAYTDAELRTRGVATDKRRTVSRPKTTDEGMSPLALARQRHAARASQAGGARQQSAMTTLKSWLGLSRPNRGWEIHESPSGLSGSSGNPEQDAEPSAASVELSSVPDGSDARALRMHRANSRELRVREMLRSGGSGPGEQVEDDDGSPDDASESGAPGSISSSQTPSSATASLTRTGVTQNPLTLLTSGTGLVAFTPQSAQSGARAPPPSRAARTARTLHVVAKD